MLDISMDTFIEYLKNNPEYYEYFKTAVLSSILNKRTSTEINTEFFPGWTVDDAVKDVMEDTEQGMHIITSIAYTEVIRPADPNDPESWGLKTLQDRLLKIEKASGNR